MRLAYTFDFSFIHGFSAEIWAGLQLTIWLTLLTILPGFALGTPCAVARMNGPRWIVTGYVEGIRNTPLVI